MYLDRTTQTARFPARQKRFAADGRFVAEGRDIGTFKDSLRAPIHRWFKYPAGYSHKLVREAFKFFDVRPGDWVLDPFSGCGTTLIEAKKAGINSIGIEAHFFVHWAEEGDTSSHEQKPRHFARASVLLPLLPLGYGQRLCLRVNSVNVVLLDVHDGWHEEPDQTCRHAHHTGGQVPHLQAKPIAHRAGDGQAEG